MAVFDDDYILQYLDQMLDSRSSVCLTAAKQMPAGVRDRMLLKWKASQSNVLRELGAFRSQLFIPGLNESSKAHGIDFASCHDHDYFQNLATLWDVSLEHEYDLQLVYDVMHCDDFADALVKMNAETELSQLMKWIETAIIKTIWITGPDPTDAKLIVHFVSDSVEGSVFWEDSFVDPVGFYI